MHRTNSSPGRYPNFSGRSMQGSLPRQECSTRLFSTHRVIPSRLCPLRNGVAFSSHVRMCDSFCLLSAGYIIAGEARNMDLAQLMVLRGMSAPKADQLMQNVISAFSFLSISRESKQVTLCPCSSCFFYFTIGYTASFEPQQAPLPHCFRPALCDEIREMDIHLFLKILSTFC